MANQKAQRDSIVPRLEPHGGEEEQKNHREYFERRESKAEN